MKFRPCIDLHNGIVKQIVGSTLDDDKDSPDTNFSAENPSEYYSKLYKKDNLTGGHVIKLGPGNEDVALRAIKAYPEGLQIGGGINLDNAKFWIDNGASHVIVTSYVFKDGLINFDRLDSLTSLIGPEKLVLDLSCRKKSGNYYIVTDRWQNFTDEIVDESILNKLSSYCCEFLIHAVDVEGMCKGVEFELLEKISGWGKIPITYAGGIHSVEDIDLIEEKGKGLIDFTVGSALDIFGGSHLKYDDIAKKYS
ncbi:MAG: phosphoribosylformimino-5-aminoimidazole carboxamide ribotide isomerase [Desulfobacterales bacterium]|nr:phosphoribosylformimino-5-aminoimidazole carboxamide ribotide isomerase [Desulfobacterales bacterium]